MFLVLFFIHIFNAQLSFFKYLLFPSRVDFDDFATLAEIIEKVFPTENSSTYFTPSKIENGIRVPSTGKLRNHFEYIKGELRRGGIIKPYSKENSSSTQIERRICSFDGENTEKICS